MEIFITDKHIVNDTIQCEKCHLYFVPALDNVCPRCSRIIWHDTRFIQYSDGPAPNTISYDEYIKMCLYFGWAHKKIIQ